MTRRHLVLAAGLLVATAPIVAQPPAGKPGTADAKRVEAGSYSADPAHTQVVWKLDHMGLTPLYGAFGAPTGTLTIDPAKPAAAKLMLTFPMTGLTTTIPAFTKHLSSADFFDVEKFPNATFSSTAIKISGATAKVTGNLTIKGVTKPITLDAKFYGAGANPMSKKLNIGFSATGKLKRSDFGVGMGAPAVDDMVDLMITAAFVKD